MSSQWMDEVSFYVSMVGFLIGLPAVIGAYYESYKLRQEAMQEREGTLHSRNCLEFVTLDGICVNLVPLETLHSLPKAGDIILLPGDGVGPEGIFIPGAYLIESVEHIYTPFQARNCRPHEARLTKAVAKVTSLNPALTV